MEPELPPPDSCGGKGDSLLFEPDCSCSCGGNGFSLLEPWLPLSLGCDGWEVLGLPPDDPGDDGEEGDEDGDDDGAPGGCGIEVDVWLSSRQPASAAMQATGQRIRSFDPMLLTELMMEASRVRS
ncbi:MAG TPA: hypothetical protein VGC54_07850 [Planctomycetota bacterium]